MKLAAPVLLAFLAAPVIQLSAETSAEALLKLQSAVEKETESVATDIHDNKDRRHFGQRSERLLSNIETFATSARESARLDAALNEVNANFTSKEVHKAAENLRTIAKQERNAKEKAELSELTAAVKHAMDSVTTARTVQDMDEPLQSLTRFVNRPIHNSISNELQEAFAKMRRVSVFLRRWQEYLGAKNSGNFALARQLLQGMSGDESSDLLPRSKILAEIAKVPEGKSTDKSKPSGEEIVLKAKSLDDLPEVVRQLREAQNWPGDASSPENWRRWAETLNALARIDLAYHEFKAGLPPRIETVQGQYPTEGAAATVASLQAQLLLAILPRYLDLIPEQGAKPDETVDAFLDRLNADARTRGDAKLLNRVKNAQRQLGGNFYRGDRAADDSAWEAYTTAQNQETAGQFMLAVVSYQKALKTEVGAIPVKLVADKLAALQSAHPQEYEAGVKEFLRTTSR